MSNLTLVMQNYNAPKDILLDAINSVMYQTCKDFNFIFIDDHSTDYDTSSFFQDWKIIWNAYEMKGKIDFMRNPENHGHSFCRNLGLDKCETEFIMFMDSDDELRPDAIEILLKNIETQSDIDISIGNFTRDEVQWIKEKDFYFNSDNVSKTIEPKIYNKLQALDILCDPYMIPRKSYEQQRAFKPSVPFCATWNKIFRKSLFDNVRFPDGRTKDDNFTAHRLIWNARKIAFTQLYTYYYRRGGKLADANLYRTRDIVDAHEDRIKFFGKVLKYEDEVLNNNNYNDELIKTKIYYNELLIYLYTQMMHILTIKDKIEKSLLVNILIAKLELVRKELLLYRPDFAKMLVEFIEKEKE